MSRKNTKTFLNLGLEEKIIVCFRYVIVVLE